VPKFPVYQGEVANQVEVMGENLVVDVKGVQKALTSLSRITIPLDHVLGAEEDQEIVRRL
jgi:hypothetical protein